MQDKSIKKLNYLKYLAIPGVFSVSLLMPATKAAESDSKLEEMFVIADRLFADTLLVSPTSRITAENIEALNITTVEDAFAHEPNLVIRKRYIGDPNGVLGIRGSGMFQTTRALVFADGLPLHYLLQTRWNGSPRWSLVSPNEIESADVIYGPYSAEYSGNAMGGVVDIKTRIPTQREFNVEGALFAQFYDELGTNETFLGNKLFASYEDKIDGLTIFASVNHLKNDSHPMSNFFIRDADNDGNINSERAALINQGVSGFIQGKSDRGEDVLYIGDSGAEESTTDLYKIKLGYDVGSVQLRGTIAYEEREREETDQNNYLRDSSGNVFWGEGGGNFQQRFQERNSLLIGLGLSTKFSSTWLLDIYTTQFEILKDEEIRTARNPSDPSFQSQNESFRARLTEHDGTGWKTLDIKVGTEELALNKNMRLSLGLFADEYELGLKGDNINSITGEVGSSRPASGGKTNTQAAFAQWGYGFHPKWDLALGVRHEEWESSDGFIGDLEASDRSESGTSPKFSLAYFASDKWSFRYSLAKAYRFPITEELFSNESRSINLVVSDPSLEPEVGIFHNFSVDYHLTDGYIRTNIFYDVVEDTIFNQTQIFADRDESGNSINRSVTTFLPIDEVETQGVEFIYNQEKAFGSRLSVKFNAAYTKAEITENSRNEETVGNTLPRIPNWRANLILGHPISDTLDFNTSFRYASDAFGDLDNGDREDNVFGAIDSYLFVNAKVNWEVSSDAALSLGMDNIFNELAYVAHPWPSRTLFVEGKISF